MLNVKEGNNPCLWQQGWSGVGKDHKQLVAGLVGVSNLGDRAFLSFVKHNNFFGKHIYFLENHFSFLVR